MATSYLLTFTPTAVPPISWKLLARSWSYSFLHQIKLALVLAWAPLVWVLTLLKTTKSRLIHIKLCRGHYVKARRILSLIFVIPSFSFIPEKPCGPSGSWGFNIPTPTSHWLKASGGKHRKCQGTSGEHQNCPHYHHLSANIFSAPCTRFNINFVCILLFNVQNYPHFTDGEMKTALIKPLSLSQSLAYSESPEVFIATTLNDRQSE